MYHQLMLACSDYIMKIKSTKRSRRAISTYSCPMAPRLAPRPRGRFLPQAPRPSPPLASASAACAPSPPPPPPDTAEWSPPHDLNTSPITNICQTIAAKSIISRHNKAIQEIESGQLTWSEREVHPFTIHSPRLHPPLKVDSLVEWTVGGARGAQPEEEIVSLPLPIV